MNTIPETKATVIKTMVEVEERRKKRIFGIIPVEYWVVLERETESVVVNIETPEKVDYVIINGVKFKLIQEDEKE